MSDPPDHDPTEEELVCRAVAGDREALAGLLGRVGPRLHDRLRREIAERWQSRLDAEDVLQVTFLECFLKIDKFENRRHGSFEAWISRICRHNLLDAIRALERASELPPEKRITPLSDKDSSWGLLELLGVTSGTPSRQMAAQEADQRVREAVAQLPRDYGQVVTLYDLESRTIDDVSRLMGRSPGAIYMLRARALDYLRESLGSESRI